MSVDVSGLEPECIGQRHVRPSARIVLGLVQHRSQLAVVVRFVHHLDRRDQHACTLSVGSYTASVRISGRRIGNSPQRVPVTLTVRPPGYARERVSPSERTEIRHTGLHVAAHRTRKCRVRRSGHRGREAGRPGITNFRAAGGAGALSSWRWTSRPSPPGGETPPAPSPSPPERS